MGDVLLYFPTALPDEPFQSVRVSKNHFLFFSPEIDGNKFLLCTAYLDSTEVVNVIPTGRCR